MAEATPKTPTTPQGQPQSAGTHQGDASAATLSTTPAALTADKAAVDTIDWQAQFHAQQQASQALEAKLNQLTGGLQAVLGTGDLKASTDDLVASLQQQLDDLQHANLVGEVARRHSIIDEGDIALLAALSDADAMSKLAARLAALREGNPGVPGMPRPDPSQGSRGAPVPLNSDALGDALRSRLGIR